MITRGRFKHPCRHFQRPVISLVVEAAPKDGMSAFDQRLVHRDAGIGRRMYRLTVHGEMAMLSFSSSSAANPFLTPGSIHLRHVGNQVL
jgi:hypothetical protein